MAAAGKAGRHLDADVLEIREHAGALDAAILYRAMAMLNGSAAILRGHACLTRAGAAYLGVEWHSRPHRGIVWP